MMSRALLITSVLVTATSVMPAYALQIENVSHEPLMFNPENDQKVQVRFKLTKPATVSLNIYDDSDRLIRTISKKQLKSGEQTLQWDGQDQAGRPVPPEAYRYTLTAKPKKGLVAEYDVSELTGGESLLARDVKWLPKKKTLQYRLAKPARVNIRFGLKSGGPLLGTLIDWVARPHGINKELWNGWDKDKVLDLRKHPKLDIIVQAFSLSDNTILVGPRSNKVELIQDISWPESRRIPKKTFKKRMYTHSRQSSEERRDFSINLTLPKSQKTRRGLPLVKGRLPVQLDISPKDRARILGTRFETTFYIDGQFVYENETGFLPMTWIWNPKGVAKGEHYITANIRGYEGHFGASTLKVYVDR